MNGRNDLQKFIQVPSPFWEEQGSVQEPIKAVKNRFMLKHLIDFSSVVGLSTMKNFCNLLVAIRFIERRDVFDEVEVLLSRIGGEIGFGIVGRHDPVL